MRVAAIDIGTNSVHLVVADVGPDGAFTVIEKSRSQVELGRGGLGTNRIAPDAVDRAVTALEAFAKTTEVLGVEAITVAATSAVREAKNGDAFCDRVTAATGFHVRVVSGVDEARLVWLGARALIDPQNSPAMLIDIGGGSVELVIARPDQMVAAYSLPLGHLRTSERFLRSDPPTYDEIGLLRKHVRALLRGPLADARTGQIRAVIGTSGSIRTLGRMATLGRGEAVPVHDHGLILHRGELKRLLERFRDVKAARLGDLPGMDPRRRATLPAAAAVLYQVLKSFGLETVTTSELALREGLLNEWIATHRPELALTAVQTSPRMRAVLRLMERYNTDRAHAEHVRDLALNLFDGLAAVHGLAADSRDLLEWAALVHDIGHHIDSQDHNRHGEYLVAHTPMTGFNAPEVAVLAAIVRYHRGATPKVEHRGFGALSRANQQRVQLLSAILRLADGLDRSHNQPVRKLSVRAQFEPGTPITVVVDAPFGTFLERWAAERRTGPLAKVTGRQVIVEMDTATPPDDLRPPGPDQVE